MASAQTIQASCQTGAVRKDYELQYVADAPRLARSQQTAPKICDSLNSCAPHKK
jgi:hypothetical protein